ncbi:DNA polymerase III subunit gamma/tau [Planctomyces sp. SH-PL62]|uniref:DNA polymerase III subunit gamma/tau n=1 Tax=Planctomyces sp. SH-PL62 TaxID=1636152 RepID=UPI00078D2B83|nr:DNA polymerase III subunit gamma/tau [Planctomyces sp. SH-PL62]AMV37242.1 DNA polymerase III subunit tau [Planctomyces sp. SH-PL62]
MSQGPASKTRVDIPAAPDARSENYTVVARRYRPQRFEDVVGQDHVVQALRNAIRLNRLAQAYLFCGTRGVGKTSMARIFAKCLNCVNGPTEEPCQVCDICQAISVGQDVDVIEIDGASNNGVEQVRELRQNVSLRPSRSRFKIYYIDEVHMLSTGAFNALLKTLEEPPPHVKFFFATTEANKIPITVLSRCQRYDFAGISPEAIVGTLKEICDREQVEADLDALQIVARRAGGSMRDAQSLLERMLSSGSPRLTPDVVHALLGTASDERLLAMIEALSGHDPATALTLLDQATSEGVQASELLAGVIDFLRDAMVLSIGAEALTLTVAPRQKPRLQAAVDVWSTDAILAALQILAEARARMRGVSHGRLLAELAFVRIARLENLDELGEVVQRLKALESGSSPSPRPSAASAKTRLSQADSAASLGTGIGKPSNFVAPVEPLRAAPPLDSPAAPHRPSGPRSQPRRPEDDSPGGLERKPAAEPGRRAEEPPPLDLEVIEKIWPDLLKKVGPSLSWRLSQAQPIGVDEPGVLVIAAKPGYNSVADPCGTDEARSRIAECLQWLLQRPLKVRYESSQVGEAPADAPESGPRRLEQLMSDPLIQKVVELFEARVSHFEPETRRDGDEAATPDH